MVQQRAMLALLIRILLALRSVEGRTSREAKILELPEQLLVFSRRSRKPVRLRNVDRLVLVYLYRPFPSLLDAIIVVKPETLLRWPRRGFRAYWHWKSWHRGGSRPEECNNTEGRNRTRSRSNFFIAVSLGLQSTTAIFRSIAQVGDRCGSPAKLWDGQRLANRLCGGSPARDRNSPRNGNREFQNGIRELWFPVPINYQRTHLSQRNNNGATAIRLTAATLRNRITKL